MGNCIRKESEKTVKLEEQLPFTGQNNKESIHSSTSIITKEVKIKITKKQLSELIGKADIHNISVHQLLKQLMDASEGCDELHHRSWRPALQSIPEVNYLDVL
ncbi:hypothetical protein HAX54_011789 [Datura stramonium]|uniref:Uncharacterized protein n=1 Tax=Datura stramonium TaxID=4076 RepID=A0ABS8Y299_DATST|nr:hypothetical protein [Datura stramonium]